MIDFNDTEAIKKIDPQDVVGSTDMFISQCEQIWEDVKKINFSDAQKNAENIIVCGMGGSAYGGYVIQSLFKDSLKVPVFSNNDYTLPAFANSKSLIFLSSYSGGTEETLSGGKEAVEKGFTISGITGGGKLSELFKEQNAPAVIFEPTYNPSKQPRLGTGYMVFGFVALLARMGYITLTDEEVGRTIDELRKNLDSIKSKAQDIARLLEGYFPVIMSSDFLNGNAHIMRNQFNETAKSFSAFEDIPELNHHLMEGLKYPSDIKMKALFLNSDLYSEMHKKRIRLTKDVVEKNHHDVLEYLALGSTRLSQMLSVLSFGGYVTLYLALIYGENPSLIPWVDYFKEQLSK